MLINKSGKSKAVLGEIAVVCLHLAAWPSSPSNDVRVAPQKVIWKGFQTKSNKDWEVCLNNFNIYKNPKSVIPSNILKEEKENSTSYKLHVNRSNLSFRNCCLGSSVWDEYVAQDQYDATYRRQVWNKFEAYLLNEDSKEKKPK